jgi:hypothetical protein
MIYYDQFHKYLSLSMHIILQPTVIELLTPGSVHDVLNMDVIARMNRYANTMGIAG